MDLALLLCNRELITWTHLVDNQMIIPAVIIIITLKLVAEDVEITAV